MPTDPISPPKAQDRLAARGVYQLPFSGSQGERFLVAVDHRGRRIMEATICPGVDDPGVVTAFLRALLDREDPLHLRLLP